MQSLSVTNLQVFELEDKGYISGVDSQQGLKKYIKTNNKFNNNNKFNLKINFSKLLSKSHKKYNVSLDDSGYLSGSTTSAETIFSIDNNNYVSFKVNPELRRQLYSSSQSLYDKSPIDLSEIFGLNIKTIAVQLDNRNKIKSKLRLASPVPSRTVTNAKNKEQPNKRQKVNYENRSWNQILQLSDEALNVWLSAKKSVNYCPVNTVLDMRKSYEYFEPNIDVKNSLLLNQNLLYQPIRRHTSELNLSRLMVNTTEMFADDTHLDSHFICDEDLAHCFANSSSFGSLDKSEVQNSYTEEIYDLFMDLHEFRINDDNIEKVAESICKIDRYLFSRIKACDLAGFLFNRTACGCGLSSLCSIIQFSQALTKIVINCIDTKIAAYQRIAYIIAFIKLSMSLYQKSNWQSLNTLMFALHSLKIYRMNSEWMQIKSNHKHYFDEFLKLSAIVRSGETGLMYTIPKGIPSLRTLLLTQTIQCLSKWDRLEHPSKWSQHPGIIDWLERELQCSLKQFLDLKNKYQSIDSNNNNNCHNTTDTTTDTLAGCLSKQFICLIPFDKLPVNWLNRSVRNIPQQYKNTILDHLTRNLKNELKQFL